jgi:UPF0755 protein
MAAKGGASQGVSAWRRLFVTMSSAALTLLGVLVLVSLWAIWTYQGPGPKHPDRQPVTVELRRGAGLPEIAAALERGHAVGSGALFEAAAQLTGKARGLKAGEYEFASGASMAAVLDKIHKGKVVRHLVTIPEGVTSEMVADILAKAPELTGVAPTPPEGAVLPETYDVRRGEDRAAVLQRMMDAHDKLLAILWDHRREGLPYKTPDEAVTLASIVEKETALASERPRIAAVFLNRLQGNIRLGSDPTIIYGLTRGRPLGHGIRLSELQSQTPYNTYQIDGLPPTPICNPGRAALAAALDPPTTDELYFVANGTGGHTFTSTLADHDKNVERLRQIERDKARPAGAAPATPTAPVAAMPKAAGKP